MGRDLKLPVSPGSPGAWLGAVEWGIASVSEKQSLNSSISELESPSVLAHTVPELEGQSHSAAAPEAGPAVQASIAPQPVIVSSPAVLPPFGGMQVRGDQLAPSGRDTGAAKFVLTSLIKTLPEPAPLPLPKLFPQPEAPASSDLSANIDLPPPLIAGSAVTSAEPAAPAFAPVPVTRVLPPPPAPSLLAPAVSPGIDTQLKVPPVYTRAPPAPLKPKLLTRVIHLLATAVKFAAIAFVAWFATVMVLIAAFRYFDPPQSMLMLTKRLSGETLQHEWVPLSRISNSLLRAVITSEDAKFCRHWGFDLGEIRAAMQSSEGYGRGASTITQQLAKNLFLWPGKSYIRKGLEVPLTLAIEGLWPKRRILEVYLNFAEWGPGIFGAESASQYYYNKPAAEVSERQAALLAISLPNPIARDASNPGPAIARRASTLQNRMRVQGISYCALSASTSRSAGR